MKTSNNDKGITCIPHTLVTSIWLLLLIPGQAASLTWNAAGGSAWDAVSPILNWDDDHGGPNPNVAFNPGDAVTFANSGAGLVTITADVLPASVTIVTSAAYTLRASGLGVGIAGSGGLTKTGTGALTLTSAGTQAAGAADFSYTGVTGITGGSVSLTSGDSLAQLSGTNSITLTDTSFAMGGGGGISLVNFLNDAAPVTLVNATFSFSTSGQGGGGMPTQTSASLTLAGGGSVINVIRINGNPRVDFTGGLTRVAGSTLAVNSVLTSLATGGNFARLTFGTAPTAQNGILPYLLANGEIAYYDAANGVDEYAGFTTTDLTATASPETLNFKLGSQNLGGTSVTLNSLSLTAGASMTGNPGTNLTLGGNGPASTSQGALRTTGTTTVDTIGLNFNGEAIFHTDTGTTTVNSAVSGAYGLTKTLPGTLMLGANNPALTGQITLNDGALSICADNQLGAASNPVVINHGRLAVSAGMVTTSRAVTLGTAASGIEVAAGATLRFDGNTLTRGTAIAALTKSGGGNLVLAGNGTAILKDFTIAGGTFTLDNSIHNITDRIDDTASVTMTSGGNLLVTGNGAANSSERVGTLTVAATPNVAATSADAVISVDPNGVTHSASLTAGALVRSSGQVLFRSTWLGEPPGAGVGSIYFDATPTHVGGGGATGTPTISIMERALGASSATGDGTGFTTYDAVNGVRLLNPATEYAINPTTAVTDANVRITANTANANALSVNSILMEGGTLSGANNLTLGSGGMILATATSAISKPLVFGTLFVTTNGGDLGLNLAAGTGITKYGTGTLTLTNLGSEITSGLTVNQGTVSNENSYGRIKTNLVINSGGTYRMGTDNTLQDSIAITVNAGGILDMNGKFDTIRLIAGLGTVTSAGPTAQLDINDNNTQTFAGTLTGNLIVKKRGNGGTLTLSGTNNTFSGGIIVYSQTASTSTVIAGAVNALGSGPLLLGSPIFPTYPSQINLNGFNQTVAGISLNGAVTATANSINSATAATLTVNAVVPCTYAGLLTGSGLALHKTGAAELTLSGVNTYAGPTTVAQGTLSLPSGSTTSAITVHDGAVVGFTLGTTFSSTQPLTLVAGAKVKVSGTPTETSYTLVTASSVNGTPELETPITGYALVIDGNSIKLNTTTGYGSWAVSKGLTGAAGSSTDPAFGADPDHDGIANGLEWILGGNPTANDHLSILPTVTGTASGGLTLVFNRNPDSAPPAATLVVEWDSDLNAFAHSITIGTTDIAPSGDNPSVDIDAPSAGKVTVNIPNGNAQGGRIFARLKAIQP
jgi:autotransporter-associated beta strand protein